ncbi:MAG: drug resistance transporter, EmrB/QacA subfamily, partial [Verrucomicrobiales bacterium]|nr:drug resistance transporter, EmrB/QacA subfamily [Verrucomicrobiales bacterium]
TLFTCIVLFTIASVLSGMAPTIGLLVVARTIQGFAGGTLQPIAQAVLLESFPPADRGVAMAVFGLGVVVAPTVGPTLGGWITDHYSWRWIFYINVPVGILAAMMTRAHVEDPPYITKQRGRGTIDYAGFALLAVALGLFQLLLDKGQEDDWFAATWIRWSCLVSFVAGVGFLFRECKADHPLVDLSVWRNRNFSIGVLLIFLTGAVLYSTITLLPLFLQTLMGYTALDAGYALSPRGIGAIASMLVIGRITKKVDNRILIFVGFVIVAMSSYWFGQITLTMGMASVVWPNVLNGVGVSFIFVPLTTMAMGTLPVQQIGNATGLYNLMRNIGGSVGISIVTTFLARDAQKHQAMMVAHATAFDPVMQQRLHETTAALTPKFGEHDALGRAYQLIYNSVLGQAQLWSFVDNFRWVALVTVVCAFAVFFFRKVKATGAVVAH